MKKVGIIGLGYVGEPLAYLAAAKGYDVVGIDNNDLKIDRINKRSNCPKELTDINNINLYATNDYNALKDREIVIVCVPTPTVNNNPDLTILYEVIKSLAPVLKEKALLIIESTVAPGMTREYVMNELKGNNLELERDYYLAYCPERIDPGNKKYWVGNINRVCGGANEESLELAYKFYSSIVDASIIKMNSIEEAELVKVWENSMRNVSIAQINLLAKLCDTYGFSVKSIINGLNSKVEQFPLTVATPGLGPGGHCIPEDIHYLLKSAEKMDMSFFREAININESMPRYSYNKLEKILKNNNDNLKDKKVIMLGISYKPNTDDIRRSQAMVLYNIFKSNDIDITIYDPIVYDEKASIEEVLKDKDIVVMGCAHNIFKDIDFSKYNIQYVFDCWNTFDKKDTRFKGITYIGTGE